MFPHERSLVKQLADKPFALIGVNSDKDLEKLRETVKKKNITWRSFWNGPGGTSGPISKRWQVRGWPTIYILDGEGVIRHIGARGAAMDKAVTALLAEMGHEVNIVHEDEEEDDDDKDEKADDEEEADEDDEDEDEEADDKEEKE